MEIQADTNVVSLDQHRAEALARKVFTLSEPWRSRFIAAIAVSAASPALTSGAEPTQTEVARWLLNRGLSRQVYSMLSAWTQDS